MENLRRFIGSKIREIRRAKNISQSELADKLVCEAPLISRYERGITLPNIEQLIKISSALEVQISELVPTPQNPEIFKKKYLIEVINNKTLKINTIEALEKLIIHIDTEILKNQNSS